MTTLKAILNAALGVTLALLMLPVFAWLGLVALGAAVFAVILGTAVIAWQLRRAQKNQLA